MTEQHVSTDQHDDRRGRGDGPVDETAEVDESVEATDESDDATPDESRRRGRRRRGPGRRGREPTEDDEDEAEEETPLEAFRRELWAKPGDWFVVHTYSGMENRVKSNLENRIISLNMEDYIHEIVVPTEEVAGDQERPAQDGQAHRPARLRPGPDGPHRRVLGRRPPHARRSPASSATATSRCR